MNEQYINGYRIGYMNALNIRTGFRYEMFGMDVEKVLKIVSDYVKKEKNYSDVMIPVGFEFPNSKYKEFCEFICMLNEQGFKVTR